MVLNEKHRQDLKTNGYTVVENVITEKQCNEWIKEYQKWLSQFNDDEWPFTAHSLLQRYNTGNLETTWKARLATKKVFSQLWKTEKLLTSVDAIAIGRPPESSEEDFALPGQHWLHCDQDAMRKGLHAYQGGLYLEHAEKDDWTFHVLNKSHLLIEEFYSSHKKAAMRSNLNKYYHVKDEDMEWFEAKGCEQVRVSVPKGGMIFWDSRLIHANARPLEGRKHPGRWRYVVLVCMGPAIWAKKADLEKKQEAYKSLAMTTHWPCQGVNAMKSEIPSYCRNDVMMPTKHSKTSKSKTVKELCGLVPYDFNNSASNGPDWEPEWDNNFNSGVEPAQRKPAKIELADRHWLALMAISIVCICVGYLLLLF